jgi:hypothetical protein
MKQLLRGGEITDVVDLGAQRGFDRYVHHITA